MEDKPLVISEDYERLGGKKLSLIDVLAQSVGFVGPVFVAAFVFPLIIGAGAAGRGAGTSVGLAVLLAAIGVFALAWIVSRYAKKIHAAGSLYDYVSQGLGRTTGAAAGWLYYSGTIVLTTALGVLIGGYVHDFLLPAFEIGPFFPVWVWDAIFTLGLFAVLYFGVQISTRVQLTLALISIAVVLIFFVTVIIDLGGDNDVAKVFDPDPSPDGFTGILFGVLYGVLAFVGFETAANLAEETAEPKRSIPRAVLGAVAIVTVFYLIAAYTEVAGFGFDLSVILDPAVAAAPLFALGGGPPYGSETWLKILLVVVFLDMLAVYIGAGVASTRGVFALARDRRLPRAFASVSTYGTPTAAIALLIVIQALWILLAEGNDTIFALPEQPHYFAIFAWGAAFGAFSLIVVYFVLSIGGLVGLRNDEGYAGVVVASLVGIAITAAAIFGSFYKVPSPTWLASLYALIWAAIGVIYMLIFRGRERASEALPELRSG